MARAVIGDGLSRRIRRLLLALVSAPAALAVGSKTRRPGVSWHVQQTGGDVRSMSQRWRSERPRHARNIDARASDEPRETRRSTSVPSTMRYAS